MFFDLSGQVPPYTRWMEGQGAVSWFGLKVEKCAALHGGHGWQWDDRECGDSYHVVCETYAQN